MGKKDKNSILRPAFFFWLIFWTVILGSFIFAGQSFWKRLEYSDLFRIKTIVVSDPSMQFIKTSRLVNLKGRNIFSVDLNRLAQKLQNQYSEIADIKLRKRFPGQIVVVTKKRIPFAQIRIRNKAVIIDGEGVVLSYSSAGAFNQELVFISGISSEKSAPLAGAQLKGADLKASLELAKIFRENKYLSVYKILRIDFNSLSQIEFYLTDTFKVIVDQNNIREKIQVLSLMLSQAKLKLEEINYIDLRFKDPLIDPKVVGK